jgi:dTDP-4-amino-4,6-dideoxygalactose transaminase
MVESMIKVTKPVMPPLSEYINEISSIWESRMLTNSGEKHQSLKARLCNTLGVNNIELFANGHLALEAAIQVLEFPKASEIITTPFTFVSTTNAIIRSGFIPIFCDTKADDGTIDPTLIESLITPKTVAILPVHIYGNLCDVEAISSIAAKHRLKVIYDAAHAFGVKLKNDSSSVGDFGDVSMFSFHATKVFHTIEGGGLAFGDSLLAEKFQAWRNFGHGGGNAKMSEFHAAMGLCNLRHIEANIANRKERFELYCELMSDCSQVRIIMPQSDIVPNYSYFTICVSSRDEVLRILEKNGIAARKYFELTCISAKTPIAKQLSEEVLTLPLYPELEKSDIVRICKIVKGAII